MTKSHQPQCSYHCDQYDFECDCGATRPPTIAWAEREAQAAQHRLALAQEGARASLRRLYTMMDAHYSKEGWPTTPEGRRFSAWGSFCIAGHVTSDGMIVGHPIDGKIQFYTSGAIGMAREQALIAAEHGWRIEAPSVQPDNFDVLCVRS